MSHVFDAVNRLRDNLSLKKSRRNKFNSNNKLDRYTKSERKIIQNKISNQKVKKVISKIKSKIKIQNRKEIFIFSIILFLIATFFFYLFN